MSTEVAWYASDGEILLATILVDHSDGDFMVIFLGRDANARFRCVDTIGAFQTVNEAEAQMRVRGQEILGRGRVTFPQGDEREDRLDLFSPMHPDGKLNPNFKIVNEMKGYSSAKEIISEMMHHYSDVDGNFIEQFQTTGFDSRLWELFLFAYFTEERLLIDRTHQAPDFIVSNGEQTVAIEAVTVHATQGGEAEEIDVTELTPQKVQELQRHYMPIKFGSPLFSKLKKKYWEMPHVQGGPLVFAIADFHAKQSMLWSSTALINYLYGVKHDFHFTEDKKLVISPLKIDFHEYKGKKIPSGFFFSEGAEHISAVMFSATGTISKFIRMGRVAGFGDRSIKILYSVTYHVHDPNAALPGHTVFELDDEYEESWSEGVSIYHNPKAAIPLERDVFPSASHHYMQDDGQIVSYLAEFHPYSGMTMMFQAKDELEGP